MPRQYPQRTGTLGLSRENVRHFCALLQQVLRVSINLGKNEQGSSKGRRQSQHQKNQRKRRSRGGDERPAQSTRKKSESAPAQDLRRDRQDQTKQPSSCQSKRQIEERDRQPLTQQLFHWLIERAGSPEIALGQRNKIM